MKHYMERNNLLKTDFSINYKKLREFFYQIYKYFHERDFFELAFKGIYEINYGNETLLEPLTMAPSPQIYFMNHLNDAESFPIYEYYEHYKEAELFTVIEILYAHIADYDWKQKKAIYDIPRREFSEHINGILRIYDKGYYLDPASGYIMELPNEPLKNMLQGEIPTAMPANAVEQLKTAIKMYYRFDSNMETKKKAINILADILELKRDELKNLLNEKFDISKNDHDKLIFDIVNNFNIRHNKANECSDYDKVIWYDWMMQYYTSVILTYYKLVAQNNV